MHWLSEGILYPIFSSISKFQALEILLTADPKLIDFYTLNNAQPEFKCQGECVAQDRGGILHLWYYFKA